ncbi:MAG: hypothetical protein H0X34_12375 [Chthoniobacterales bacterium]|nr:hypothetical protein [Chthoniobacterales bacterium]
MSLQELKTAAAALSEEERLWLAAYLRHLSRVDSEANAKELRALDKRIDDGHYVTLEQLKQYHSALETEGK